MSQTQDTSPEVVSKLRRKLREDTAGLIRAYPDIARELANEARLDGHDRLADRIEGLLEDVQEEST